MPSPQQSLPSAQSLARDSFLLTCEGSVIAKVLPSPISAKSLAFMAVTALEFQLAPILQRWGGDKVADRVTLASAVFHTLAKTNSPFFVEVLRGTSLGTG